MKSRITIEVDFENWNQPSIQILSRDSDDVRDRLIKEFYQTLGTSSWCKIEFRQDVTNPATTIGVSSESDFKRIFITPIPEKDLKKEAEIMLEQSKLNKEFKSSNKNREQDKI